MEDYQKFIKIIMTLDINKVKKYINDGGNKFSCDRSGRTALAYAVRNFKNDLIGDRAIFCEELKKYLDDIGVKTYVPTEYFVKNILGFDDEEQGVGWRIIRFIKEKSIESEIEWGRYQYNKGDKDATYSAVAEAGRKLEDINDDLSTFLDHILRLSDQRTGKK